MACYALCGLKAFKTKGYTSLQGAKRRGNLITPSLFLFSPDFGKYKLKELHLLSKLSWEIDESIEAIPYSPNTLLTQNPKNFAHKIIKTGETIYDKAVKH